MRPRYWRNDPGLPWGPLPANSTAGLLDLIQVVGPCELIVEVGCFAGVSTEVWAAHADHVIAVDSWLGAEARARPHFALVECRHPNIWTMEMGSVEASLGVPDRVADLVYIDAGHSFGEFSADLRAWMGKVKDGGWIGGHDYAYGPWDVRRVVDLVFTGPDMTFSDGSWLVRMPGGRQVPGISTSVR